LTECTIAEESCSGLCTGWDGSNEWKARMDRINDKKIYTCETCQEGARDLEIFSHDIKNAQLGKPLFNKKNFKKLAHEVKCICDKTGVC